MQKKRREEAQFMGMVQHEALQGIYYNPPHLSMYREEAPMHLTAEHRKRLEAQEAVDPLTQAKWEDIVMPVALKGEEGVFDLEPLIDYIVFELQQQQQQQDATTKVRHPFKEGKELVLADIEAVTGDGVSEKNEEHVKVVLEDFEADIQAFLCQKRAAREFTEAEVNKAAEALLLEEADEGWKRKKEPEVNANVRAFLEHVETEYGANFEVGDAKALHESIQKHVEGGDEHKAYAILDEIEQLLDGNAEVNVISDYNHDTKTRVYIFNPDEAKVKQVQKREMAVQKLLLLLASSSRLCSGC